MDRGDESGGAKYVVYSGEEDAPAEIRIGPTGQLNKHEARDNVPGLQRSHPISMRQEEEGLFFSSGSVPPSSFVP